MKKAVITAASLGLAVSGMSAATPVAAAPADWDLILTQDAPVFGKAVVVDGRVIERTWEAVLRNGAGKKVGLLLGTQRNFDARPSGGVEMRYRTLVFEFADGQIVAEGIAAYKASGGLLKPGKRSTIAITGGTGAYIGASGELKTVHKGKGIHRQMLRFVD
jgi:hypothetical protein